jgi:hypothetical protein
MGVYPSLMYNALSGLLVTKLRFIILLKKPSENTIPEGFYKMIS